MEIKENKHLNIFSISFNMLKKMVKIAFTKNRLISTEKLIDAYYSKARAFHEKENEKDLTRWYEQEYNNKNEIKREYLLNPTISIADEQKMKTHRNYKYIENLVISENEIRQNGMPYLPPAGYDYKGLFESVKRNLLLDFYHDKDFFTMIGIDQIHDIFIKRMLKAAQNDFDCPVGDLNIDFERYERELKEYFYSTKL